MQGIEGVGVVSKEHLPLEVTNFLINLKKNNKDISGKDLRPQLSNIITICTESLTFLVMENLDRESIRRQYLSKILPCKAGPS